jgi:hypothetical protein
MASSPVLTGYRYHPCLFRERKQIARSGDANMTLTNGMRAARCRNAIVTVAIAVILLCAGRASAWAATSEASVPPLAPVAAGALQGSSTRGTPATSNAPLVADSYADREANARELENFKGGDVVIIGGTGLVVVLLLLIILLSL